MQQELFHCARVRPESESFAMAGPEVEASVSVQEVVTCHFVFSLAYCFVCIVAARAHIFASLGRIQHSRT